MLDSIPGYVIDDIKKHIQKECKNAELIRGQVFEKEDSITASILGRLATPKWQGIKRKQWKIDIHIPSNDKKKELSESKIGADGIIQIVVYGNNGELLDTKGMIFQAKKTTESRRGRLNDQVAKMQSIAGKDGCAVFIYDLKNGYRGIEASDLENVTLNAPDVGKSLGDFIANDFLDCKVGKKDLSHSLKTATLFIPHSKPIRTDRDPLSFILNISVKNWVARIVRRRK